jgi:oxaloacetate decarboxylase alpha subunit
MLSSLEAAKLGVSAIHVGIGPGATGLRCEANRMLANLEEAGHTVSIDKAALAG